MQKSIATKKKKKRHDRHANSGHHGIASKFSRTMTAMAGTTSTQKLTKEMMVLVHSLVSFKASTSLKWGKRLTRRCFPIYFPAEFFRRSLLVYFSSLQKKAKRQQTWKGNEMKGVDWWVKMRMGRPGPGLGPGPMASRPILRVMGRPISPRCYVFDGPLGIMGRPKYFFIILNHEYYEHF